MLSAKLAALQGRVSPAWESIDVKRHIFLLLCSIHSVTAYEVNESMVPCFKVGRLDSSHLRKAVYAAVANLHTFR